MSRTSIDSYLERLDAAARAASGAEDSYRREAVERIKVLERARAFAFRRLNLVHSVAQALAGAKDEEEAVKLGSSAFLRELNWSGATESQREVAEKFKPIILLLWQMNEADSSEDIVRRVDDDLAAFERWFEEERNGAFLSLMDGEVLELPLVEV